MRQIRVQRVQRVLLVLAPQVLPASGAQVPLVDRAHLVPQVQKVARVILVWQVLLAAVVLQVQRDKPVTWVLWVTKVQRATLGLRGILGPLATQVQRGQRAQRV